MYIVYYIDVYYNVQENFGFVFIGGLNTVSYPCSFDKDNSLQGENIYYFIVYCAHILQLCFKKLSLTETQQTWGSYQSKAGVLVSICVLRQNTVSLSCHL